MKIKIIILLALAAILAGLFWLGKDAPAGFDHSISDGTIIIDYPSRDFGLAVKEEQLLIKSYIPACDPGFMYCFYYLGQEYAGTNFESAGIAVKKRPDLAAERLCLDTPPEGFSASVTPGQTFSHDAYAASIFENVGGAGAGHMAAGRLYRLFTKDFSACHEFTTRIGQSQFLNYPEGSIQEFTQDFQSELKAKLETIVKNISFGGQKNLFK